MKGQMHKEGTPENRGQRQPPVFLLVRPAGARSNECKSRIHPAVGRI